MSEQIQDNLEEEDTMKDKYLTFLLDQDVYAVEIRYVIEIIGVQDITEVPELPEYIKGVINIRGKIVPVMDVRLRFNKPEKQYTDRTCTIVIQYEKISIGLIVDTVADVIIIGEENVIDTPSIGRTIDMRFVKKIGKVGDKVKLLLDCHNLLTEEEEALVQNME
jgi:purine-binding chemotaxis protein CheW